MKAFAARLLSYWKSGVVALVLVLSPRIVDRISDALIDAGVDWAWRRWQLPTVFADLWILLAAYPLQAAAWATIVWVSIAAAIAARAVHSDRPNRQFWEQMEQAFDMIATESEAIGQQNIAGSVTWSVYPANKGDPRDRDRFLVEAPRAGAAVRSVPKLPRRYETGETTDPGDDWLNVVTAMVHFSSGIHGSGSGGDFGAHGAEHFENVVRASRDACHLIANNETRRQSSPPSKPRPRKPRGGAKIWTPSGFIDAPTD